jgi:hypothetical protein
MFFRTKKSGPRSYLQLVDNHGQDGRPRQRVLATLGRIEELRERDALDGLLRSGARRRTRYHRPEPDLTLARHFF